MIHDIVPAAVLDQVFAVLECRGEILPEIRLLLHSLKDKRHLRGSTVDHSLLVHVELRRVMSGTGTILFILNANKDAIEITIPQGKYSVVCCDGVICEDGLSTIEGNKAVVDPQSALIIHN